MDAEQEALPATANAMDAAGGDGFGQLAGDAWRILWRMPGAWWALFMVMGILNVLPMLLRPVPRLGVVLIPVSFILTLRIAWTAYKMLADELGERPSDWRAALGWSGAVFFRTVGFLIKTVLLFVPLGVVWMGLSSPELGNTPRTPPASMTIASPFIAFLFGWRFATASFHYVLGKLGFREALRRSYGDTGRHLRLFALTTCIIGVASLIKLAGDVQGEYRAAYDAGKLTAFQPWQAVSELVGALLAPFISTLVLLQWLRYGKGASLDALDLPRRGPRPPVPARSTAVDMRRLIPFLVVALIGATWQQLPSAPAAEPRQGRSAAGRAAVSMSGAPRGFPTIATTAPPSPTPLPPTFPDKIEAVTIDGGLAYVGSGERLYVIDVEDSEHPKVLGSAETGIPDGWRWFVPRIVVRSGYAYLLSVDDTANGDRPEANSQLVIFDIAAPANPRLLRRMDIAEIAVDLILSGDWLLLAAWQSQDSVTVGGHLIPLSLADPARPRRAPAVDLGLIAFGMTSDDRWIMASGMNHQPSSDDPADGMLALFERSPDGFPSLASRHAFKDSNVMSPAMVGNTLAGIHEGEVVLIDLEMPASLIPVDDPASRTFCDQRFVVALNDHFVARNACDALGGDLQVLAVQPGSSESLADAEVIGQLEVPYGEHIKSFLHPVAASGDRVYVVSPRPGQTEGGMFYIVDVSEPTRPRLAATLH